MKKLAIILLSSSTLFCSQAFGVGASDAAMAAMPIALMAATRSGVFATAAGTACKGGQFPMCAMAGLSLAQLALSLGNKSNSAKSAADLSSSAYDTSGSGAGTSGSSTGGATGLGLDDSQSLTSPGNTSKVASALAANGLGGMVQDYKNTAAAVNAAGLNVATDGSKVTMPNGKSVTGASFGSAQSMVNSGFSPSDAAAAQDFLNSQNGSSSNANSKKIASLTNADGSSGGGGSGGSGGAGGSGGSGGNYDSFAAMKAAMARNNKGSGVSGMSKKFGSDNIGVSGDNIFDMISRRYKARDQASSFLKN